MEKELEYFIKEKTKYCAPENWAFLVAQKLIDHGWIKPQPQATSELDELREWLLSKEKGRMLYDPNHYFVDVMIQVKEVLAKIDSLKSGDK